MLVFYLIFFDSVLVAPLRGLSIQPMIVFNAFLASIIFLLVEIDFATTSTMAKYLAAVALL